MRGSSSRTGSWCAKSNIVSEDWHGAPLRIAAISDTHVGGPHVDAARMGRIVARINELRPDLVVLLGDYVNGHAPQAERSPAEQQEIAGGIATFAALTPRYGVVGVIGNHDGWYGRATITEALQDAGVARFGIATLSLAAKAALSSSRGSKMIGPAIRISPPRSMARRRTPTRSCSAIRPIRLQRCPQAGPRSCSRATAIAGR